MVNKEFHIYDNQLLLLPAAFCHCLLLICNCMFIVIFMIDHDVHVQIYIPVVPINLYTSVQ